MVSESESVAIKYIRVTSMLAIVLCHVLQAYSNRWAFVFNIGVQVFLALSGYLYGEKFVSNWKQWAVGRLKRVYVPFVIFLIAALPLYLFFHREVFSWKAYALNYLNLQGIPFVMGGRMLPGIRHLWFLTAIMFAWLATPLLQKLNQYARWLFPILIGCVGISYFIFPGRYVFIASWIFLYAICYLFVNLKQTKYYSIGLVLLEVALIVLMTFKFNLVTEYFNPINRVFHDVSGVFIVIIGTQLISRLNKKTVPIIVDFFDKYSFHVFIVHYFFVIGPFSLAHATSFIILNVLLIIATTIVATLFFVRLNNLITKYMFNIKMKNN